jgi:hypothetical protein
MGVGEVGKNGAGSNCRSRSGELGSRDSEWDWRTVLRFAPGFPRPIRLAIGIADFPDMISAGKADVHTSAFRGRLYPVLLVILVRNDLIRPSRRASKTREEIGEFRFGQGF